MKKLNVIDWLALVLVIVGGLNWGLIGVFNFNLVGTIFGSNMSSLSSLTYSMIGLRVVYALVGLSAIYLAVISMNLGKK